MAAAGVLAGAVSSADSPCGAMHNFGLRCSCDSGSFGVALCRSLLLSPLTLFAAPVVEGHADHAPSSHPQQLAPAGQGAQLVGAERWFTGCASWEQGTGAAQAGPASSGPGT